MSQSEPTFLITGGSGQLGRLVVEALLETVAPSRIAVFVRDAAKVRDLAERGVGIRIGTYDDRPSLETAIRGFDRVLLVSGNEFGKRRVQHGNVIAAAANARVSLLAYTSILHCDRSPLLLAGEHKETEALLAGSGVPYALLRNGWYFENDLRTLPALLSHKASLGASGDGRFSEASRADYARAAAAVLLSPGDGKADVYELAGDASFTKAEFAAELSRQTGESIPYQNMPAPDFKAALIAGGLPEVFATYVADADLGASTGALFDDSRTLSKLIGRPTTSLATAMATELAGIAAGASATASGLPAA